MSEKINTNRCSPVQMRKSLEMVEMLKQAGIEFVPVPVIGNADRSALLLIVDGRLQEIDKAVSHESDKRDSLVSTD